MQYEVVACGVSNTVLCSTGNTVWDFLMGGPYATGGGKFGRSIAPVTDAGWWSTIPRHPSPFLCLAEWISALSPRMGSHHESYSPRWCQIWFFSDGGLGHVGLYLCYGRPKYCHASGSVDWSQTDSILDFSSPIHPFARLRVGCGYHYISCPSARLSPTTW